MIKQITSLDNPIIKKIFFLKQNPKNKYSEFILEGKKLIDEAISNGCEIKNIIFDSEFNHSNEYNQFLCLSVPSNILKKISDLPSNPHIIAIVKYFDKINPNFNCINNIIWLNNIQDPGNLGTIIRTSNALGVDLIILDKCVSIYNSKVIRSSMGSYFKNNFIFSTDVNINELKNLGFKIYGTFLDNESTQLFDIKFNNKSIIILGNEGNGIESYLSPYIDKKIYIPIKNNIESLNVASAASIILYEWLK